MICGELYRCRAQAEVVELVAHGDGLVLVRMHGGEDVPMTQMFFEAWYAPMWG